MGIGSNDPGRNVCLEEFTLRVPIFLDKALVVQMWRHDSEAIRMALIPRV